jgi:competence protein ComEA
MDESAPWRALETGSNPADVGAHERHGGPSANLLMLLAAGALAIGALGLVGLAAMRGGGQVELVSEPVSSEVAVGSVASQPSVVVQVAGAVLRPGVYTLPAGSRVGDAIKLAGGYSADVDPRLAETALNLAAKLTDSQLIVVPRRGDPGSVPGGPGGGGVAAGSEAPGLVNLNTATAAQLDTLPGIGPATAAKIIAAREESPFASVDDLVKRKIVTASVLAKFRGLVTVG